MTNEAHKNNGLGRLVACWDEIEFAIREIEAGTPESLKNARKILGEIQERLSGEVKEKGSPPCRCKKVLRVGDSCLLCGKIKKPNDKVKPQPGSDVGLEVLFDAINEHSKHGGRMVFWTCPKGCRAIVDWDHDGAISRAVCRKCGSWCA